MPGREVEESVICLDSLPPPKKIKADKPPNAAEQKAARVDALAVELQERHVDRFNKIQYKLWAETIDCGKHKNKDVPPAGSIWNQRKAKPQVSSEGMDAMASVVADKVVSVLKVDRSPTRKDKEATDESGMSPGKKIAYQEKLLNQIDQLHKMYERGAITGQQFEKRRDSLFNQLDMLST